MGKRVSATVLYTADVRQALPLMASGSVDCAAFSPPYWSERCFGDSAGQIGLEPTIAEHLAVLAEVTGELKRILADTGTLFLNYRDIHVSRPNGRPAAIAKATGQDDRTHRDKIFDTSKAAGLPQKSLCLLPQRIALMMLDQGWIIRNFVIWHKPNAKPERRLDRFGTSYEVVIFAAKASRYYFDPGAVMEPTVDGANARLRRDVWSIRTSQHGAHTGTYPEELARLCVAAGCPPNGVVLDPFAGVGTTCVAAASIGRRSIGIELEPRFAALAAHTLRSHGYPVLERSYPGRNRGHETI